jgi:hypothetical protein
MLEARVLVVKKALSSGSCILSRSVPEPIANATDDANAVIMDASTMI